MQHPVDDQRRRCRGTGAQCRPNVRGNALNHVLAAAVGLEAVDVEAQSLGVSPQVRVIEAAAVLVDRVVQRPERPLKCSGLGGVCQRYCSHVTRPDREVPEAGAHISGVKTLCGHRTARAREVGVCDHERRVGFAAHVVCGRKLRDGCARQRGHDEQTTPATSGSAASYVPGVRVHVLHREQLLPYPPGAVFPFFADAVNLESITPPLLRFRVTSPQPLTMGAGALIDYRLRIHGLPIRWRTLIEDWCPPHRFVDTQLRGPYARWHHTHTFREHGEGQTLMTDTVRYAVGYGPFGELAHRLLVKRDVEQIFDHRAEAILPLLARHDHRAAVD